MKKILIAILIGIMAVGLVGCNGNNDDVSFRHISAYLDDIMVVCLEV